MITKNKNILYILYPATFLPLALTGSIYAGVDFSNALYVLYALLPFFVSSIVSLGAAAFSKSEFIKNFTTKCSLARFAVLSFATFLACLITASVLTLAIRGRIDLPLVLGAWMVMLTIFSVYLFLWLYVVYRIFYKNNPEYI